MDAFERTLERELANDEFRAEWEASEDEYQVSREVIRARIARGMTQTELAKAAGIDQRVISRVETGETLPTVRTLNKIAGGLGDALVIKFVPKTQREDDWEELMEG